MGDITEVIRAAAGGDRSAMEQLHSSRYAELRQLAWARLTEGGRGAVLDTSAEVHDGFLRMIERQRQKARAFLIRGARASRRRD
ncbi:MAG: hypothetical protein LAO51_19335 [Acidobacteriia bacterium]|nr:hypothetical protein [Terriglobia bacterium]